MNSAEGSTVTFRRVPNEIRPRALLNFASQLEREVSKGRTFDCLITGDAELRRLNREFRGKDEATDVLSFPSGPPKPLPNGRGSAVRRANGRGSERNFAPLAEPRRPNAEPGPEGAPLGSGLGDIAISLARARTQAREFGHTTEQELRILMLHGVLHLLGMNHESDRGQMARVEKRWRMRLGLPNGLIERVRS